MLQQSEPQDFVIGTGETHTIRSFIDISLGILGYLVYWEGNGEDEVCKEVKSGKIIVKVNPEFYRPSEVDILIADPTKAREVLGWTPKISFDELVKRMILNDVK